MKPVKVGICGLGTVGGGTFNVLKRNAEEIARRAGRGIEVVQIALRSQNPQCDITGTAITRDPFELVDNPEIEIVIELIGGYGIARDLVLKAIDNGKHVVTANKALIAVHGNEIFARAREKGVIVAFEAAVAGGIPVIKAIREGLAANRINWLAGIINVALKQNTDLGTSGGLTVGGGSTGQVNASGNLGYQSGPLRSRCTWKARTGGAALPQE